MRLKRPRLTKTSGEKHGKWFDLIFQFFIRFAWKQPSQLVVIKFILFANYAETESNFDVCPSLRMIFKFCWILSSAWIRCIICPLELGKHHMSELIWSLIICIQSLVSSITCIYDIEDFQLFSSFGSREMARVSSRYFKYFTFCISNINNQKFRVHLASQQKRNKWVYEHEISNIIVAEGIPCTKFN